MEYALGETNRRRAIQEAHNKRHGIEPTNTQRALRSAKEDSFKKVKKGSPSQAGDLKSIKKQLVLLEKEMKKAAENLEFETAMSLREQLRALEKEELRLRSPS